MMGSCLEVAELIKSCTFVKETYIMEEKYIICEDSIEGIFTAIYDAYALREGHEHLHIQVGEEDNYRLFAVYMHSLPDSVKTDKVARTLRSRLGEEVYSTLCHAAASYSAEKGEAVYRTVVEGITAGSGRRTMENLRNPYVRKTFELARRTANEVHRELEFIRFQELEQGILYAKIGPENHVMPFVMPHFADRLAPENFMVHDEKRRLFGVHPAGQEWFLVSDMEDHMARPLKWSAQEERYQELFGLFHGTIAIAERTNTRLQQQMLPLRFQDYMVEFNRK